jgi:hypothetical protein
MLVGGASNAITSQLLTNGQLMVGNTGNPPSATTLTQGAGMSITNAAGSITLATAGGGFNTVDATLASYTLLVQTRYVTDRGGGVAYTLPASGVLGDVIKIVGKLGAWTIAQNANQQIVFGSASTTITTGGLASTNVGDCVSLICTTAGASTIWTVEGAVGNITIT